MRLNRKVPIDDGIPSFFASATIDRLNSVDRRSDLMNGLLIANKDQAAREQMASLFRQDDYQVTTADSVVNSLEGILDKTIQVVLLGGVFDEQQIAKFVPLLKKCNRNLSIVLVSDEMPLELLRRIRKEGIFYHALKPVGDESWDEIRQAISCAFENYHARQEVGRKPFGKKVPMQGAVVSTWS